IVSRIARRTKNAAKDVASLVITKFCTKFERSVWRLAIQPVPMPPFGRGAGTPNDGNQLMSCGRVRNTIAENIHFAKFPPTNASGMDPCLRLSPASTRQMMAADGASSSITLMKSVISCGGAIVVGSKRKLAGAAGPPAPRLPKVGLSNSTSALGNPELQQSCDAGDHEKSDCREHPLAESTPHGE